MQSNSREYQKVIAHLSDMIADGKLKIGDRLPTERYLAEALGISRNSTREALRMLEYSGMIACKRGSGNYLIGNVSQSISEMVHLMLLLGQTNQSEICSFRRNMEKAVCRAILEKDTFSKWEKQADALLEEARLSTSLEEQIELDRQFHFLLIYATENHFLITLMEPIATTCRNWIDVVLRSADDTTKEELQQIHAEMLLALKQSDFSKCEIAIDRHYDIVNAEHV